MDRNFGDRQKRMRKTFCTSIVIAIAMIGGNATRASAACPPTALTGPFCVDGDDNAQHHPTSGVAGQTNANDPLSSSGTKELSPTNGNIYKLYNVNYATPPGVLNLLSMPDKVDLVNIATQSAIAQSDGHLWFYFAWTRATTNGSGFITVELEKNGLNATNCNYGAVTDFTNAKDPGVVALIANCNPWAGRRDNDILISWNQVGNSNLTLFVQHWCAIDSLRPDCQGIKLPSWGSAAATFPNTAKAAFCDPSGTSFCGEAAIDLTALQGGDRCTSFANIIPNTVTGNTLDFQATSDYKDTVFFNFPPVANCGKLTVTKRLVDADGKTMQDANATFGYKVDRQSGLKLRFDLDVASAQDCASQPTSDHCVDGPAPQLKIERPNAFGGVALKAGVTDVHDDLIPANDYRLVETSISSVAYVLVKVVCMASAPVGGQTLSADATAATTSLSVTANAITNGTYIIIDSEKLLVTAGGGTTTLTVERAQLGTAAAAHTSGKTVFTLAGTVVSTVLSTPSGTFQVSVPVTGGYQQTDCVITNQFVKANSSISTAQRVKVNDSATVTLGNGLTASDTPGDVTIKLYSGDSCVAANLLKTVTFTGILGGVVGTTISVTTNDSDFGAAELNKLTASGSFSWTASYSGDAKNNPTSALQNGCHEATTVTIDNNK